VAPGACLCSTIARKNETATNDGGSNATVLPQLAPDAPREVGQLVLVLVVRLGLPSKFQAALEVRGRSSGRRRSLPVVIATARGSRYLVSMLGPGSDWVKNVEAAHGEAIIRQGRRHSVHLARVPLEQRAPIIREYVRIASSGRRGHRRALSRVQDRTLLKAPAHTGCVDIEMRGTVKVVRTARRLCAGHHVSGFSLLTEAARGLVFKRVN
jgi:hypothetical protein